MKKLIFILLMLSAICLSIFATDLESAVENDEFLKEILISDIPVTYGDESFRERILQRTEGKRDPIGLVLTGGSARACAHIGVLRYLDEQGIVPDFIVSNSMGSIIGMLYAAGITPDQIEEILRVGDISSYFALTLPSQGGFLDPSGFKALIDYIVGEDYRMEETDIPVMVVCDDLVSKREVRITEGPFTDVLIASFALPVYFNPYKYNGHLLIDVGVISLAPIDAAYEYTDTVILSTTFYDADTTNLINPVTILNSSFDIGKRQNASADLKKYTDLIWIRCAVEQFSFMAFKDATVMADIGYECTALESEALSELYKGERTISQERSQEIANRIEETRDNLHFFGRLKATNFSQMLGLSFSGFDSYYLKNSMISGLRYRILWGDLDMAVVFGFGSDTQNLASTGGFTTLGAEVSIYPFSNSRIKLEGYFDSFRGSSGFYPQIFGRESVDVFLYNTDYSSVSVHQSIEYYRDFSKKLGKGIVLSVMGKGSHSFNGLDVEGKLGYMMTAETIVFEGAKNYAEVGAGITTNTLESFNVGLDSSFRISLDGRGSVPRFISDGYVGTDTDYGATSLYTDSTLFNLFINADASYQIPFDPTFGEFLIVENPTLGVYASSLISLENIGISIGGEIRATCSLIGLIKLPLRFRLGYEIIPGEVGSVIASLTFSTTM